MDVMDVVDFYLHISHGEGSTSSCNFLETRYNKQISSHSFAELSEIILKDEIFEFDEKFSIKNVESQLKQRCHLLMLSSILWQILRTKCQKSLKRNQLFGGGIWIIYFSFKNMVNEKSLSDQEFVYQVSMFHSAMKFTVEYSNEEVSFSDLNIKLYQQSIKVPELDLSFLFMFLIIHICNNIKIKLTK